MAVFAFYIVRKRLSDFLLLGLASYGLSKFIDMIIKSVYQVQRPYLTLLKNPLVTVAPHDSSFPSGHATSAFLLATLIYSFNKKLGMVFYCGAILVSLGRVLALVHYPLDVIAGAILGTFSTFIILQLVKKVQFKVN